MKIKNKIICFVAACILSSVNVAEEVSGATEDFTLKSRSGENFRLEDQLGNVVLLNFWASWCGPCRKEMPILQEIHKKYADLGFMVVGVNVDKDPALGEKLLSGMEISFPVVFDPEGSVSKMYKVDAMPTTVIIDRDGNKRFLHLGYQDGFEEHYEQEVKALVRE